MPAGSEAACNIAKKFLPNQLSIFDSIAYLSGPRRQSLNLNSIITFCARNTSADKLLNWMIIPRMLITIGSILRTSSPSRSLLNSSFPIWHFSTANGLLCPKNSRFADLLQIRKRQMKCQRTFELLQIGRLCSVGTVREVDFQTAALNYTRDYQCMLCPCQMPTCFLDVMHFW